MKTSVPIAILNVTVCTFVLLGSACRKQAAATDDAIARVGDAVITRAAFDKELASRAKLGQSTATFANREAVLEQMIRLEVLHAKALQAGYDRDPELASQFKKMVAARYEEDQRKTHSAVGKPDREALEQWYAANKARYTSSEKVRVAVLFVRAPAKADAERTATLKGFADELRAKAVDQAGAQPHFGLLAQEHSDDQVTRYQGGDCGWLTPDQSKFQWDSRVLSAAFALRQTGEISPVVRAASGFYIFKLIDRKAAETAPFEQVRGRIEHEWTVAEQKRLNQQFEIAQRTGVRIHINTALLQAVNPPALLATNGSEKPAPMSR